jgi:hypothetical protein
MDDADDPGVGTEGGAATAAHVLGTRRAGAAPRLDPGDDGLFGRGAHGDDEVDVVALEHSVQDLVPVLDDGRGGVLGQPAELVAVLAKDGVEEGVEEEVGAGDAQVVEEMLHPGPDAADEGAVGQRFILRPVLADDQHLDGVVLQTATVEHGAKLPAE